MRGLWQWEKEEMLKNMRIDENGMPEIVSYYKER